MATSVYALAPASEFTIAIFPKRFRPIIQGFSSSLDSRISPPATAVSSVSPVSTASPKESALAVPQLIRKRECSFVVGTHPRASRRIISRPLFWREFIERRRGKQSLPSTDPGRHPVQKITPRDIAAHPHLTIFFLFAPPAPRLHIAAEEYSLPQPTLHISSSLSSRQHHSYMVSSGAINLQEGREPGATLFVISHDFAVLDPQIRNLCG